jgi:hypothetical protein
VRGSLHRVTKVSVIVHYQTDRDSGQKVYHSRGTYHYMKGETRERWEKLCQLAAEGQNPEKLMRLVTEINRLLDEKKAPQGTAGTTVKQRAKLISEFGTSSI